MSKSSFQSRKPAGQAPGQTAETGKNRKKKWLIGILIGVAAVLLIARIAYFAWPKSGPVAKLIVEDMVVGTGKEVKTGDALVVEYIGWVYGKDRYQAFDMSANHELPFSFLLGKGEAIEGWDKGLVGMKVGGQRKLTIPPALAYGDKGALNGKIPPHSALVFEVELLDAFTPLAELPPTAVKTMKVEDLVIGTGAEARAGSIITLYYTGWLENGTQFDSSRERSEPIEFILGEGKVIEGWDLGLVGMKVGGKRRLTIPPDLAYGADGARDYVPPNAALIFEVELLTVR